MAHVQSMPKPTFLDRVPQSPMTPLVAAILVMAPMLFRPGVLNDGDTWWHVAAGEWMLSHGRVLHTDIFSYTHYGRPWVAHEWLSEIVMALAYRAGGWSGILVLFALATALTAALLTQRLSKWLNPLSLALTLALAFWVASPSLLTRPHVLALPLFVAWMGELLDARGENRRPSLWLAPLMVLWANLHGSFVFGFMLYGFFGLEALIAGGRANLVKVFRDWSIPGVPIVLAALLTPHGITAFTYPFQIMGMKSLYAINEWKPSRLDQPIAITGAFFITLAVCLGRGVKLPPVRLALLLLLLFMAIQHRRHAPVLGLMAPLLLAEPLMAVLGQPKVPGRSSAATLGFAVFALGLIVFRLAMPVTRTGDIHAPVNALERTRPELKAMPVLNEYAFGGYLIFKGHKVFIDGRGDMYGDVGMQRYLKIENGDRAATDAAVRQYGIGWAIATPHGALKKSLDAQPLWRRIYEDKQAVVYERLAAAAVLPVGRSSGPKPPSSRPPGVD